MQHKVVDIRQNDQNGSFLPREHWIVQYVITDGSFATSAIESKTIHPNIPQRMLQFSGLGIFQRLTF